MRDPRISIYMRLAREMNGIGLLVLEVGPDFALSEAAVLYQALKPAYMSMTYGDWRGWSIGK